MLALIVEAPAYLTIPTVKTDYILDVYNAAPHSL
jgi:hypothetical protein